MLLSSVRVFSGMPVIKKHSLRSCCAGSKFPNYNIREYIKRRVRDGFRELQGVRDAGTVDRAMARGKEELEVVRRQAMVYQLYGRTQKNVLVRGASCRPTWIWLLHISLIAFRPSEFQELGEAVIQ